MVESTSYEPLSRTSEDSRQPRLSEESRHVYSYVLDDEDAFLGAYANPWHRRVWIRAKRMSRIQKAILLATTILIVLLISLLTTAGGLNWNAGPSEPKLWGLYAPCGIDCEGARGRYNADEIHKSPSDTKRKYKIPSKVKDMEVLLVQDTQSSEEGAALDVGAGSMQDGDGSRKDVIDGLAHLTEHSIFLANDNEPGFQERINTLGGSTNAFTSETSTNFKFVVAPGNLEEGLMHFGSMIARGPPSNKTKVRSEISNVNSEHEKNRKQDDWRIWQLLHDLADSETEFNHFPTGTEDTLNVSNIFDKVEKYYKSNYYGANMKLVVLGHDSLDDMALYVRRHFSDISSSSVGESDPSPPRRSAKRQHFHTPSRAPSVASGEKKDGEGASVGRALRASYGPLEGNKVAYLDAVGGKKALQITWALPKNAASTLDRTTIMLERAVNSQGRTVSQQKENGGNGGGITLFEHLREQGKATSVTSGTDVQAPEYAVWSVTVSLTEEGVINHMDVISDVVGFMKTLNELSLERLSEVWKEANKLDLLSFRFAEKPSEVSDFTSDTANLWQSSVQRAELLGSPERSSFNSDGVQLALSILANPSEATVILCSPPELGARDGQRECETRKDKSYGFEYDSCAMPQRVYDRAKADHGMFSPPPPSMYIPSRTKPMWPRRWRSQGKQMQKVTSKQEENEAVSVRYSRPQSGSEQLPKVYAGFEIAFGSLPETAEDEMAMQLAPKLAMAICAASIGQAAEAGSHMTLERRGRGLHLEFHGYSDVMPNLVKLLLRTLRGLYSGEGEESGSAHTPTQGGGEGAVFKIEKEQLNDTLREKLHEPLYKVVREYMSKVSLDEKSFTQKESREALETLNEGKTAAKFNGMVEKGIHVESMVVGDVSTKYAKAIQKGVLSAFNPDTLVDETSVVTPRTVSFPSAQNAQNSPVAIRRRAEESQGNNTVTLQIHQLPQPKAEATVDVAESVKLQLLERFACQRFFSTIRTEKQLGYVATCYMHREASYEGADLLSIRALIQGSESPETLSKAASMFFDSLHGDIEKDNGRTLRETAESLRKRKVNEVPRTLKSLYTRMWDECLHRSFLFSRTDEEIKFLKRLLTVDIVNATEAVYAHTFNTSRLVDLQMYSHAQHFAHVGDVRRRLGANAEVLAIAEDGEELEKVRQWKRNNLNWPAR